MSEWLYLVQYPLNSDADITDSMIASNSTLQDHMESCFMELGFKVTERGVGFGVREMGMFGSEEDVRTIGFKLKEQFHKAWLAKLWTATYRPVPDRVNL